MVSASNGKFTNEIQEESGTTTEQNNYEAKDEIPLYIATSQRGLLDDKKHKSKFLNPIMALPRKPRFMKFDSSKFSRLPEQRDEISRSVSSPLDLSFRERHLRVPFVRKINWAQFWVMFKQWIKQPMNMALFAWIACVGISGAILFLVMTGMLNGVLHSKTERDTWFEVNNQILNALFTLMVLYQHPKRIHHLVLLCRWRTDDILRLRKIYCKDGTYKPNEWFHMMVVVALLQLNCFAQYALCGLNLGYPRSERPAIGVGLCLSVAIASPALASVYNILSPLGKEYETTFDQEAQGQLTSPDGKLASPNLEKRYSFMTRENERVTEKNPEWIGGLFDFWDDIFLAYLSIFCSCCVFGWNMDRLGFGNMYVHIVTFLLFCLAPFFIFNLAAVNINNEAVREALGIAGFVLCIFGLLYGGFWRIQMRKRFNLPSSRFCCGKPDVTDCFQWLCCCCCSLAQEVRTADYYDVVDDKFCAKHMSDDPRFVVSPLPREDASPLFRSGPSSPYWGNSEQSIFRTERSPSPSRFSGENATERLPPTPEGYSSDRGETYTMKPSAQTMNRNEDIHTS